MTKRTRAALCIIASVVLCACVLVPKAINSDDSNDVNAASVSAELIYEESVSPNEEYVTKQSDIVTYTIRVYQAKDSEITVSAESNSPLFDGAEYSVDCDSAITAEDVKIQWMTLSGGTQATEDDQLGLAQVSISQGGEVISEKVVSFVGKAAEAITDAVG